MTIYDRPPSTWRAPASSVCLAGALALAVGLMLLPARVSQRMQFVAQSTLRPGLLLVAASRARAEDALQFVGNIGSNARRAAELETQLTQLRQQRGELEAHIAWLSTHTAHDGQEIVYSALIRPRLREARVLGRRAQSYLQQQGLLDQGANQGIVGGDLVLEAPAAVVDQGAVDGLRNGNLVLAGRRVWGKIAQAHDRLSIVARATDAGYRDLVRVLPSAEASANDDAPRGVLEGTGEPLCRLRLVPLTQAVAVGQWVAAAGNEGFLAGELLYGQIERVEQTPGAGHWSIWVRPALATELPQRVLVLGAEVRAARSANAEALR